MLWMRFNETGGLAVPGKYMWVWFTLHTMSLECQ